MTFVSKFASHVDSIDSGSIQDPISKVFFKNEAGGACLIFRLYCVSIGNKRRLYTCITMLMVMFAGCLVILACFQTLVMCHIIFVSWNFDTHEDRFSETNV